MNHRLLQIDREVEYSKHNISYRGRVFWVSVDGKSGLVIPYKISSEKSDYTVNNVWKDFCHMNEDEYLPDYVIPQCQPFTFHKVTISGNKRVKLGDGYQSGKMLSYFSYGNGRYTHLHDKHVVNLPEPFKSQWQYSKPLCSTFNYSWE